MAHKPNKPNVVLGMTCSTDFMKAKTAFSLIHATNYAERKYDMNFCMEMSCDIIGARCRLVHQARKLNATHLLFVDYDMFFAPDSIQKLLDDDKDIVGAAYNFRKLPQKSTAFPMEAKHPPLFKCHVIGTGLMLIRMEVFDRVPEPWFRFGRDQDGNMVSGEDTHFCQEAQKVGFDVWADSTLQVSHLGEYTY